MRTHLLLRYLDYLNFPCTCPHYTTSYDAGMLQYVEQMPENTYSAFHYPWTPALADLIRRRRIKVAFRVIPGGYTGVGSMNEIIRVLDNGSSVVGYATVSNAQTLIKFQRSIPATNWSAATNTTYVLYTGTVQVS
jgi:hypothetical protein